MTGNPEDRPQLERILKASNIHGLSGTGIDAIDHELAPTEQPLIACRVQELIYEGRHLDGLPALLLTDSRLLVMQFIRGFFNSHVEIQSIRLDEIESIGPIQGLRFSIELISDQTLDIRGIGTLSKKFTQSFHDKLIEVTS